MAKPTPTPGRRVYGQKGDVEHIGNCVVCKLGIFSDQEHGRALKPLLGKAHTWCIPTPAPESVPVPVPVSVFDTDVHLTRREREILQLVGCGLNVPQVAERLWLSPRTVEAHMTNARGKLRVHSSQDAARAALDAGLIPVLAEERFPTLAELCEERFGGAPC